MSGDEDADIQNQFSYRLDFEPPPKGIFVTQFGNLYDKDEAETGKDKNGRQLVQFPMVEETGESLLRKGVKTKQKTLLIREQMVIDKLTEELKEKRSLFDKRMEVINARKEALKEKQEKLRKKINNDQRYIIEQNGKRDRAVEKFKGERKTNERLAVQQTELSQELDKLKIRNRELRTQITKLTPYNDYMNKVVDSLPDKFIDVSDNKVAALMSRHSTLSETNGDLVKRMNYLSEELSNERQQVELLKAKHSEEQLEGMMEVKRARETLDRLKDRNQEVQQNLFFYKTRMREDSQARGQTLLSLRNLAEKCRFNFRTNKVIAMPLENDNDFDTMLYRIGDYVTDHKDIVSWTRDAASDSQKSSVF